MELFRAERPAFEAGIGQKDAKKKNYFCRSHAVARWRDMRFGMFIRAPGVRRNRPLFRVKRLALPVCSAKLGT
jgi:hypothetical protein